MDIGNARPAMFLRSFFGFSPEEDGYIGWTRSEHRAHVIEKLKDGDLFLIYGAGTGETPKAQQRQVLGVLQVDVEPIRDVDKASKEGMARKASHGWTDKWSYALPVRRAWRSAKAIPIDYVARETYNPSAGQAIATWSPELTDADVERVMKLEMVEVPVFGEPPLPEGYGRGPLIDSFRPSPGVTPSFGEVTSTRIDGEHRLYVMKFDGDVAALLGRPAYSIGKKHLVKVGFSNDIERRCGELNAGLPPAGKFAWRRWLMSGPIPSGEEAKLREDALKAALDTRTESLGGEFFLGDEIAVQAEFAVTTAK